MVLDFSRCKGAFMLPSEFRAKEIDENPKEENIAEPSSVEEEPLSEEAQDPEKKENKKMENLQEAGQDIVQVVQLYSPNIIDFDNKKILIRSDQTESTIGKNVVIDKNVAPRMIKPKNPEVGVRKVDERKRKLAPGPKQTVKQLLDKYTSHKANTMFNRLGGNKRAWSRSRHGGHEHWQENSYKRRPYFPVYPPWGFSSWMTYRTRPAGYFQSGWISSRPMFRQYLHEKRGRFNPKTRPRDAIVVRGDSEKPFSGTFTRRGRYYKDGKNYNRHHKFAWVPVKHPEPKPMKSSDDTDTSHGLKPEESKTVGVDCGVQRQQQGSGIIQKEATFKLSLQNGKGGSIHAEIGVARDGLNRGCTMTIPTQGTNSHVDLEHNVEKHSDKPAVCPSTGKSADVYVGPYAGGIRNFETGGLPNRRKIFSPECMGFRPKAAVWQYRPKNSGGSRSISVAPGIEPGPKGLTHTQKRRVQRLRALVIQEGIAEKTCDEWFSQDRPVVPLKMTWRKKLITMEENKNTDNTVAAQNFENNRDAPTDMDVDQGG
jgi:hypothetical protein